MITYIYIYIYGLELEVGRFQLHYIIIAGETWSLNIVNIDTPQIILDKKDESDIYIDIYIYILISTKCEKPFKQMKR